MTLKSDPGNFFEDFVVGDELVHATPRTVTEADAAIYTGLTGSRFALYSADTFAQDCGLPASPIDPLLAFHVVFGKTVPDISLNAVANLGYADGRFLAPVFPGDTLRAVSEVIGVKENSNGKTGVVWVRTTGYNQEGDEVLTYVRWVMVNKKDPANPAPTPVVPDLPSVVDPKSLPDRGLELGDYNFVLAGSPFGFDGKTLIHPTQVEPCNTIFAPPADAVAQARDVIAAFADPANAGKGVLKVNGKMTELLHLAQAQRLVAVAEAIAQREAAQ